MTNKLTNNYTFLKNLANTKSCKKRKELINKASKEEIEILVEICLNLCKGNCKINKRQLKKLQNHCTFLRSLAKKRTLESARKVIQIGEGAGIIPILLKALKLIPSGGTVDHKDAPFYYGASGAVY